MEETWVASAELNRQDGVARARKASELLFGAYDTGTMSTYEPRSVVEAEAAVNRFAELFSELPGTMRRVLDVGRDTGELVSSDRLQGLAEIIQNADDVHASEVRLTISSDALLMSHDGDPVRLRNILGFATPWLSTKSDEASSIGRFGIGLTTLRSLSTTIEIHCSPYHVSVGSNSLAPMSLPELPSAFQKPNWTTLRVPIDTDDLRLDDLEKWLDRWDDSALLFLRSVSRVTLLSSSGEQMRELRINRSYNGELEVDNESRMPIVQRHRAIASDGRSWMVYGADFQSAAGVSRKAKATGKSTPVAVALPLEPTSAGRIHAGLPVARTSSPVFVSAQFDPLTNRLDLAYTDWNRRLVPLIADLWLEAALDLFSRDPKVAWHAVPLSEANRASSGLVLVEDIEKELTDCASRKLSARMSFPALGHENTRLSQLAVEVEPLEGILTEFEIASLSGQPATLPSHVRDTEGAWRSVLDSWRSAGADLPKPVTIERALDLIGNETRSPEATITLTSVALIHDLSNRLLELPCVIAHDGRYLVPPVRGSPKAVAAETTELAQQLGVVTLLHASHLRDECSARRVLDWLEACGALIDGSDERSVVYRIATAGNLGGQLAAPLNDEQVQALRTAFELLDRSEHRDIGRSVGRALSLEAYTYKDNQRATVHASPAEAYLPRRIDRDSDSFAAAAEKTPGPVWLSDRYATILRSPAGRTGIGAQRFLRILGSMSIPRPRPHSSLQRRFHADNRLGLSMWVSDGSEARREELKKHGADFTLQDYESRDIQAVVEDISRDRDARQRRKRSRALITALGRAWDRDLREYTAVDAALAHYYWHIKPEVHAFWLWQIGDIAWLDDESGCPRRPRELRIRTPGTEAIYGDESRDYLHKAFHDLNRTSVLTAIGVSGDPTRSELIERLKGLRDSFDKPRHGNTNARLKQEVAVVYKALAHDLVTRPRGDLPTEQLRREFRINPGLVLTNHGWRPPGLVLAGDPIFGDYGAFAIPVSGAQPLWRALNLREPSQEDCIKVIHSIARKRNGPNSSDQTILLETLRMLSSHYTRGNTLAPRRVRSLALWTSKAWIRERPVYATDDPVLARGLRDRLPIWKPGGDLDQFRPLLAPFRIEELRTDHAEVIDPPLAWEDSGATELFRSAVELLEEDLARNEPRLSTSIRVPWDRLRGLRVSVHPSLSLRILTNSDDMSDQYISSVDARIDLAYNTLFIRNVSKLARVDGGGRAIAAMFQGNARRLAHAWRAVCDKAEDGIRARDIDLAHRQAQREQEVIDQGIDSRTRAFQRLTEANAGSPGSSPIRESVSPSRHRENSNASIRVLVDPGSLRIVDSKGRVEYGSRDVSPNGGRDGSLVEPQRTSSVPQSRTPVPNYSSVDRESVGMEIVRMLLCSDFDDMVDLRTQRGVGADAIDKMNSYYELKVSAGAEPDRVSLTNAEFNRLLLEPNYFLIIVSNIEGVNASPRVRVFVDPLKQLQLTDRGSVTLTGVRNATSLVYELEQNDNASQSESVKQH